MRDAHYLSDFVWMLQLEHREMAENVVVNVWKYGCDAQP